MIPIHTLINAATLLVSPPRFSITQSALLPLVFAALLIDSLIIAVWYMLGYVLNNSSVRTAARNELYQLIGTAVIMAVVIFGITLFSGLFQSALSGSSLLSPSALQQICNNVGTVQPSGLQIEILTPSQGFAGLLCQVVGGGASAGLLTNQVDYPLAAAGVVLENLTYQSVVNLNSLFVFDSYIGFLSKLTPDFSVCVVAFTPSFQCEAPIIPVPPLEELLTPSLNFEVSAAPYAGVEMIYRGLTSLGILFTTAVESFILQLTFASLFLYIWPLLIFIGLILRATIFTRKIGGLFIAVAIGAVFFYPLIFAIQYLTLGNGLGNVPVYSPSDVVSTLPTSISTLYGYNGLTSAPLTALPANDCVGFANFYSCGTYTPNFYVFPSVEAIVEQNGCWPVFGDQTGAITAETGDILSQIIPFVSLAEVSSSLALALAGGFIGTYPVLLVPFQCPPMSAENTLFALINAYGIYGISAYLLPILDVMITISAIIGLSGLLGGDTELAGLSKLV